MTDLELATAFFKRIQEKGFKLNFNTQAYGEWMEDESHFTVIELLNAYGKSFCDFDFYPDGDFHRISGFTSGCWQDEVDWNKY